MPANPQSPPVPETPKTRSSAAAAGQTIPADSVDYPKYEVRLEGPGVPTGAGPKGAFTFVGPHTGGAIKMKSAQGTFVVALTHADTTPEEGPKLIFEFTGS